MYSGPEGAKSTQLFGNTCLYPLRSEYEAQTAHDCDANAVPYTSSGALGHGWECGLCGAFLQAG